MFNSQSSQSSSLAYPCLNSEDDDTVRPCTVYLYIREIAGSVAHRWTLYFDWGDYSITYEAYNDGGTLMPSSVTREADEVPDIKELGQRRISPQIVGQLVEKNTLNGSKYSILKNNCQHWAQELARKLNFKIQMGEVAEAVSCAAGVSAFLGSLSVASSPANNK